MTLTIAYVLEKSVSVFFTMSCSPTTIWRLGYSSLKQWAAVTAAVVETVISLKGCNIIFLINYKAGFTYSRTTNYALYIVDKTSHGRKFIYDGLIASHNLSSITLSANTWVNNSTHFTMKAASEWQQTCLKAHGHSCTEWWFFGNRPPVPAECFSISQIFSSSFWDL